MKNLTLLRKIPENLQGMFSNTAISHQNLTDSFVHYINGDPGLYHNQSRFSKLPRCNPITNS